MSSCADREAKDDAVSSHPSWEACKELCKVENGSLRALYTMVVLEATGFAMCIPVLAFFAIKELGLSPSQLGIVASANAASQLVGASICGRLSDSFGRRWLLLGSFIWSALNIGALSLTSNFTDFLIMRIFAGLSGGTTPLCQAFIMDSVGESRRPAFLGLFGSLLAMAFMIGNCLGVCLIVLGLERRSIFLVAAVFALLATLYGVIRTEESLAPQNRRPLWPIKTSSDAENPISSPRASTSDWETVNTGLVCVWVARFLQSFAFATLFTNYAFFIHRVFGWSDFHFGVIMMFAGVISATLQFVVYPLFGLHGKKGSAAACVVSSISGACACLVFPLPVVVFHLLAIILFVVSMALFDPAVPVLVSIFVGRSHLGFGNGIAIACRCAASILGPVTGGILFEKGLDIICWVVCGVYLLALLTSVGISLSPACTDDDQMESEPLLADKMKTSPSAGK